MLERFHLSELPTEILLGIISFVSVKDIFALMLTSKQFKELADTECQWISRGLNEIKHVHPELSAYLNNRDYKPFVLFRYFLEKTATSFPIKENSGLLEKIVYFLFKNPFEPTLSKEAIGFFRKRPLFRSDKVFLAFKKSVVVGRCQVFLKNIRHALLKDDPLQFLSAATKFDLTAFLNKNANVSDLISAITLINNNIFNGNLKLKDMTELQTQDFYFIDVFLPFMMESKSLKCFDACMIIFFNFMAVFNNTYPERALAKFIKLQKKIFASKDKYFIQRFLFLAINLKSNPHLPHMIAECAHHVHALSSMAAGADSELLINLMMACRKNKAALTVLAEIPSFSVIVKILRQSLENSATPEELEKQKQLLELELLSFELDNLTNETNAPLSASRLKT